MFSFDLCQVWRQEYTRQQKIVESSRFLTTFRSCLNLKKIINNILNWLYCLFQSWWWKYQWSETSCFCWELHKCIKRIRQLARIWCWHGVQWQILLRIFYFSLSFSSMLTEGDGEGWKNYLHTNIQKRSVHKTCPPGCHVSLTADRVLVFFFLSSVKVVEEWYKQRMSWAFVFWVPITLNLLQ